MKKLSILGIALMLGIFTFCQAGFAMSFAINLQQPSAAETGNAAKVEKAVKDKGDGTINPLRGGLNSAQIVAALANATLKNPGQEVISDLVARNAEGSLAEFISKAANTAEIAKIDSKNLDEGIDKTLKSIGLNRVESQQDIISLPASKIVDMKKLEAFLGSPEVVGKAVVIVANNNGDLDKIRRDFKAATGRDIERIVWLKMLRNTNLSTLETLFDQYQLSIGCSLDKVGDKDLAKAIGVGI
jgi:hypothetical protein